MSALVRWLGRMLRRLVLALVLLIVLLLVPVGYTEVACRGTPGGAASVALIDDPAWQRAESRTLTTYPEWHIVYAYQDYAEVLRTGDPHGFGYVRAIAGFWRSLCPLARQAAGHGGFDGSSKATIYTIGVSFTLELALKAAYEETIGRLFVALRGEARAPLDEVSARQAADYAAFLHQVPWYRWDFIAARQELAAAQTEVLRDRERALALGLEYSVKAAYAGVIEGAVAATGQDQLRLRAVVTGLGAEALAALPEVTVIGPMGAALVIETPRYAAFTELAVAIAAAGGDFVEIAGNDDILITTLGDAPAPGALYVARRQGFGDIRSLQLIRVAELAETLRSLRPGQDRLEHIHDY